METCPSCMSPVPAGVGICPTCGSAVRQGGDHDALPAGSLVYNKYRVEKFLGRGGFGITYKAVHNTLQRVVALKEYFPEGAQRPGGRVTFASRSEDAKKEFLTEGQTLGKLDHPNIVRVTDIFEESGTAYLVMDFVEGTSLGKLVAKQGALSEQEALEYIRQAALALKAVHAASLLHQDIKPDNLMRRNDGSIVLIDFGAARHFVADKTGNYDKMLTLGYAPIEQYGTAVKRGPYTDFYALSGTLYYLLGGGVPPAATDRTLNPKLSGIQGFSPRVQKILERGMAFKPTERPQNADEFLKLLGETAPAVPSSRPEAPSRSKPPRPEPSDLPPPPSSPHLDQVDQILDQLALLKKTPSSHFTCPFCQQGEMKAVQPSDHCPECRQASLITPQSSPQIICPDCRKVPLQQIDLAPPGHLPCPNCRRGELKPPAAPAQLRCPACKKGDLANQIPNRNRCPLCRTDNLVAFTETDPACPNCKKGRLRTRHKTRMLVVRDKWVECDHCQAEWDVVGKKWKLMAATGQLASQLGQTLDPEEWQKQAQREDRGLRCKSCSAEFDQVTGGLRLAWTATATPLLGKVMSPLNWTKLAYRLPPQRGSHRCPRCSTEFDLAAGQMQVVQDPQGWLPHLRQPMPLAAWQRLAAGKQSPEEGYLCTSCHSEWNDRGQQVELVVAGNGSSRYKIGTRLDKQSLALLVRGKNSGKPGLICRNCEAEWDQSGQQFRHLKTGETLPREGWQARGLGRRHPSLGPTCSSCGAEWVVKTHQWELVTQGRSATHPVGTAMDHQDWRYLAGGKQTPGEGFKCTSCRAELTLRKGQEYIQTYPRMGEARTRDAWLRIGQNLPDPAQAASLKRQGEEALRKAIEAGEWRPTSEARDYPKALKNGEAVIFSLDATLFKQVAGDFKPQERGTLWFTTQRLLFHAGGKSTDISYSTVEETETQPVEQLIALGVKRYDREKPTIYLVDRVTATRHQGNDASITVDIEAQTLKRMIDHLSR